MSKYCPIVERKITYQFCQDCDDRVCEQKKYETDVAEKETEEQQTK